MNDFAGHKLTKFRLRATLFVAACLIYWTGRAPFFGQWDSFDYLKQIVTHRLSDLGFGRPIFIGYNIALWEAARRLLNLAVIQVDTVIMNGAIFIGATGVLLFSAFAGRLLSNRGARMASVALLLSPIYAVYSGFIMTEVPMLTALVAAALALWASDLRHRAPGAIAGGVLFGAAIGIREQAVTLGAAYLWILWVRRADTRTRLQALVLFGAAALATVAVPILALYLHDPTRFFQRTRIWLNAIPMGQMHFWSNFEASILFTLAICPAAWLGCLIGSYYRLRRTEEIRPARFRDDANACPEIPHPIWGIVCSVVIPLVALWRDADVQIHPRYAMIALPGALIMCVYLFERWAPAKKAALTWGILQIVVFGIAQAGIMPLREIQREKRAFSESVLASVPESALIISGGYSPILDYYRGIGVKPSWFVWWSGWGWDRRETESTIRKAWAQNQPVYWCSGPYGWIYFEDEWLDLYFMFKDCRGEEVAPGITLLKRR